jgi:hypothetical protein
LKSGRVDVLCVVFSCAREADRRARRTEPGGGVFLFRQLAAATSGAAPPELWVNDAQRDKSDIFRENSDDASQDQGR